MKILSEIDTVGTVYAPARPVDGKRTQDILVCVVDVQGMTCLSVIGRDTGPVAVICLDHNIAMHLAAQLTRAITEAAS